MLPVSDVIPSRTTPFVTIALIAASTLAFGMQALLGEPGASRFAETLGLTPAHPRWFTALSSLFVHAGWLSFLINMLCLWIFGENVEDRLGHRAFGAFYLGAGALSNVAGALLQPGLTAPLVGPGPAVAAVMGAYFVAFPGSQVLVVVHLIVYSDVVEAPAGFLVGLWVITELVTHLAPMSAPLGDTLRPLVPHVVALVAGAVAGALLRRRGTTWT
jgi:membrane associated rhomboid family serine protease